jgi:hypothetical protein
MINHELAESAPSKFISVSPADYGKLTPTSKKIKWDFSYMKISNNS